MGRRLRRFLLLAAGVALLVAYMGSYYYLSRRGMHEAKVYNMRGFYYVPIDEVSADKDLTRHHALVTLYAPLNLLDQELLGSKGPGAAPLWGLSK